MKKIIILFVILFISAHSFGQDKGFVAVSFGAGIPLGDFASTDVSNQKAGYAKAGGAFDISFGYKLGKSFGLAAMLRSNAFSFESQAVLDELNRQAPDVSWTVESESWVTGGFYFGGYGSFPIGTGNTTFEIKGLLGLVRSSSPKLIIDGDLNGFSETATQVSEDAGSLGILLSAGFRFSVSSKVCFLTNLDYLATSPEFKNVQTISSSGTSKFTFSQPIAAVNVTVGIGLRLGAEN